MSTRLTIAQIRGLTASVLDEDYILPPRAEGEAEQPPLMFLASLDAMFTDMCEAGVAMEDIVVINTSGQQHGHVYLSDAAVPLLGRLDVDVYSPFPSGDDKQNLQSILAGCFAYPTAPIWMTGNTVEQTHHVRQSVGGSARMIERSGSDAPPPVHRGSDAARRRTVSNSL